MHTPLLESPLLNEKLGFSLWVKPECLQKTGAFKLRGAYHFLATLTEAERKRGVVAFSSGNHAQAVAYVARHFGIPATIVMPGTAPRIKRENTKKYGAQVILYDPKTQNREQVAEEVMRDHPSILVKPFDDEKILLGQGTAIFEALQDCRQRGCFPRRIYVPCSGGGLLAGSALAASAYGIPLTAAEPQGFDSVGAALRAGEIQPAFKEFPKDSMICDALLSPVVGKQCYPLIAAHVDKAETVSEAEVLRAMRVAFHAFKLVLEPGGAAGLAVALRENCYSPGENILVILSGGNVDQALFTRAMTTVAEEEFFSENLASPLRGIKNLL